MAWVTSLAAVASVVVLGVAAAATAEASELLLVFGMVPWARWGAWLGLLAGVLGLWTIAMAIRARGRVALPAGTLFGLLLTGLAAVGLAAFILIWGLSPL
jgi:hypothetical protein